MDELLQEINAAKELISRTLAELKNALPVEDKTALELAGISIFLQNAYNGIENIFKRILLFKKISVPDSKTSHKDLLDIVVENGIISFELSENIDKYRAFRHFSIHGYGINLDKKRIGSLAENIVDVYSSFEKEIEIFLKKL
ncbi:MAG: hypothetical protein COZ15_04995 [Elusimicrobia bacterium CG_4_10_14_3_um_filter_49_12_50_7]|nr:MAG: hypothetical protein COZ15_04995 [Elusimicrobia bacterium CG_4_10_14_3_um_filter_49_12_50_7]